MPFLAANGTMTVMRAHSFSTPWFLGLPHGQRSKAFRHKPLGTDPEVPNLYRCDASLFTPIRRVG